MARLEGLGICLGSFGDSLELISFGRPWGSLGPHLGGLGGVLGLIWEALELICWALGVMVLDPRSKIMIFTTTQEFLMFFGDFKSLRAHL